MTSEVFFLLSGTICLFLSPTCHKSAGSIVLYRDIALPNGNGLAVNGDDWRVNGAYEHRSGWGSEKQKGWAAGCPAGNLFGTSNDCVTLRKGDLPCFPSPVWKQLPTSKTRMEWRLTAQSGIHFRPWPLPGQGSISKSYVKTSQNQPVGELR